MKEKILIVLLVPLFTAWLALATEIEDPTPSRVRIGVDIRMGFQSCMDSWLPVAEYLSKAIPEHRFVIVPLASRQDLAQTLENGSVAFTILNPALEVVASDQYGTVPLATMVESDRGDPQRLSSDATCSGAVIRRTDRWDIASIQDVRRQRLSAVKPWSFTGWIAQWGLLEKYDIDPYKDLKEIVFEGTHEQVVKSVLDGSADVGAVDAELLDRMAQEGQIPDKALFVIDRQGKAVPLVAGVATTSTPPYPGWALAKTEGTSNELARRVADALRRKPVDTSVNGMPYQVRWVASSNYGSIRRLLQGLMGSEFIESPGYPMARGYPAWLFPASVVAVALVILAVAVTFIRSRFRRREDLLRGQLEKTRKELTEVRAQRQRIDAILARAGCGIDIVDDQNQVVYADSNLERRYGSWQGRKCHEYFCESESPCDTCRRPGPTDKQDHDIRDINGSEWTTEDDPHAQVHNVEGNAVRMIGIPFRDEKGRWLYARLHLPLSVFSEQRNA